jgi:uncharacterized membrane protein YhaH (DUF805 family)
MGAINWGDLLFGFNGRINRAKYWIAIVACIVLSLIGSVLAAILGDTLGLLVNGIIAIATLVISIAAGIKRLHDRNKSGWWLLLFLLAPGILLSFGMVAGIMGVASGAGATGGTLGMLLSLIGAGLAIWAFVELGCLRGTVGPNQYGPDPLGGDLAMAGYSRP